MTENLENITGFVGLRPSPTAVSKRVLQNPYQGNKDGTNSIVTNSVSPENTKKSKTTHSTEGATADFSMVTCLPKSMLPSYFLGTVPEMFVIELQGGIELIYCNQGNSEAFVQPLVNAFFQVPPENKTAVALRKELVEKTQILCVVPRRVSHKENVPQTKPAQNGTTTVYKKMYFVRYPGYSLNNNETRRNVLETLADVSGMISKFLYNFFSNFFYYF